MAIKKVISSPVGMSSAPVPGQVAVKVTETEAEEMLAKQEFIDQISMQLFVKHGQCPKCFMEAEKFWQARLDWLAGKWVPVK